MKNKVTIALGAALTIAATAFAVPHGGPRPAGRAPVRSHRPAPRPAIHHHHKSTWGRGGSNFWPGFVGGIVGGIAYESLTTPTVVTTPTTVVTTPTVVTAPTVVTTTTPAVVTTTAVETTPVVVTTTQTTTVQKVWVPGRYIDQILSNGRVIRVWQPGHYEQRVITVQ